MNSKSKKKRRKSQIKENIDVSVTLKANMFRSGTVIYNSFRGSLWVNKGEKWVKLTPYNAIFLRKFIEKRGFDKKKFLKGIFSRGTTVIVPTK